MFVDEATGVNALTCLALIPISKKMINIINTAFFKQLHYLTPFFSILA
jgi:hypothetical protein